MPAAKTSRPKTVRIGNFSVGNDRPLFFIAGPCIFESAELLAEVGVALKRVFATAKAHWVLKCSFDKANRTSPKAYRGRGMAEALEAFAKMKKDLKVPFLTDVHLPDQAEKAAAVADVLQIPAFLCRQSDLLEAAGRTGKVVNVKKGQFLSPWEISNAADKVAATGNRNILLTERGSSFGYGNLVVDMRGLEIMAKTGYPVVFDATHSCQHPGSLGDATGGQREFAPTLARAAAAVGVAGVFLETHPRPEEALSDGPNSVRLKDVAAMIRGVQAVDRAVKNGRNTR
ncbi:MAG: 3-deoxy-8-phosphooctulonate synthase [Elusimicrobia bacterium CG1_02_63_36]|nr:MAG: 3-deoxy-8-phosphooctulonate synthase [Elusimicrobia bacterium CG1_02_63_36]PIP81946.1 MAG: 3-deoxy-8-phosphooctulonate synthase [Elusimicrobia bacterium CG22_combo_CG10-13_8_21_14_all_63_91]PJA18495.1 MAG: 3-deoxy-8-phosphooctulonate synthase [Elusimicrobia bacterium CG_4_10_14_0_2_um_filter_63_34]PJB24482.1 MAG: 3-deoxy-8-phosphooctulonate synthase [Elusimicrobia bacterium CG_4_9_14_3_um_filter_62_55]